MLEKFMQIRTNRFGVIKKDYLFIKSSTDMMSISPVTGVCSSILMPKNITRKLKDEIRSFTWIWQICCRVCTAMQICVPLTVVVERINSPATQSSTFICHAMIAIWIDSRLLQRVQWWHKLLHHNVILKRILQKKNLAASSDNHS